MGLKIVFLDFDGVLNRGAGPFEPGLVKWLNRVTNMTGAKIVVHSSWRYAHDEDELARILARAGVHGEVLGATPRPEGFVRDSGVIVIDDEDYANFTRGLPTKWSSERPASIQLWLDSHPDVGPEDFVIFDDTAEMAHLAPRFLRTTMNRGLTQAHAEQAIRMLLG